MAAEDLLYNAKAPVIMPESYELVEADLLPLSIGAAFLGAGGGGNPYIGMLRAREVLRQGARVRVLNLEYLPGEAMIGVVGGIGAPVVGIEKIEQGRECYRAMRAVEGASGIKFAALISAEIGGANAIEPIIVAALSGVPVIDGDGMGRAFPEVQMTTFSIYGAQASPAAISDDKGNVVVYSHVIDMFWLEKFARNISVNMGGGAGMCMAPMRMDFVRQTAVPFTLTRALEIGRTIINARVRHQNVVSSVLQVTGSTLCFTGKTIDVRRELTGGFACGHAIIAGSGAWAGCEGKIEIQNENLVLWVDGVAKIMVPDLIINLDLETGEPLTTEVLRFGQRVAVIGMPVHNLMKTPRALKIVGPHAFGYPHLTYTPLVVKG